MRFTLLSRFGCSNLPWMTHQTFDSKFFHQVHTTTGEVVKKTLKHEALH